MQATRRIDRVQPSLGLLAAVCAGCLVAACSSGGGDKRASGGATRAEATGGASGGSSGPATTASGGSGAATGGSGGATSAPGSGGTTSPAATGGATTVPDARLGDDGFPDDVGRASGGTPTGGSPAASGGRSGGAGGATSTGPRDGGRDAPVVATGGAQSTGGAASGGASGAGGSTGFPDFPCPAPSTDGYHAVMTKSGSTWTVTAGGAQKYSGGDTQAALAAAYGSLSAGRTSKQRILVQGDGDIPASAQVGMPSFTVLNWCGTLDVSGTPSGSDRSPLYARGKTDIDIPNLKMTGSPMYGIFMRETNNVHLGHIELRLTRSAGIGIRADSGGSASTMTTFNRNLTIDYVYGTGMGSHIVETYGIDGVTIGTVEGKDVGECGLLLNRSINAQVGLVTCDGCAAVSTGYAAFRVANDVGKVGSDYPAGNIHVGKVVARGGGRGIFSVSGCGGLVIDQIDIANVGNTSILLQNTYNTTIAAVSGTVVGGLVQISNDTTNTNNGKYPASKNVTLKNLTLSGGASVRQDWCSEFGRNGCTAVNITGGTVAMCP